jgi:serine/threonine protein kinase
MNNKNKKYKEPMNKKTGVGTTFINQGTFGCVYRPTLECSSSAPNFKIKKHNQNYISKVSFITNEQWKQYTDSSTSTTQIKQLIFNGDDDANIETQPDFIKESFFGKIIQTIPNHTFYFAPILDTCPIDVKKIPLKEYNKCKIFNNSSSYENEQIHQTQENGGVFIGSKIKFIQGEFLNSYFKRLFSHVQSKKKTFEWFFSKFYKTFLHLIHGIHLLQNNKEPDNCIIHFDLKNNNILFDTRKGIPIIIDFGLSFTKSMLFSHPSNLKNIFYVYYDKYPVWCLDIVLLSYVTQHILNEKEVDFVSDVSSVGGGGGGGGKEKTKDEIMEIYSIPVIHSQNIDDLHKICENFTNDCDVFKNNDFFTKNEIQLFLEGWKTYISSFLNKKWKDFILNLSGRHLSWDIYSISIIYLFYLEELHISNISNISLFLNELKQSVVSFPTK